MALPPSWTVLHNPTWPGRRFDNIDHVVVGPSGVFVIDTKSWSGRITVEHGLLLQGGRDQSPAVWGSAAAARSLSGLVPSVRPDHVHAVVCVAEGPHRVARVDDVMVCSPAQLVAELAGRAEVLPGGLSTTIAADVGRHLNPVEPSAQLTSQDFALDRGHRRRPYVALVLVVLAIAVAVALVSQPDVLTSFVDDVRDSFAELGD
jgi:hypothetical protein